MTSLEEFMIEMDELISNITQKDKTIESLIKKISNLESEAESAETMVNIQNRSVEVLNDLVWNLEMKITALEVTSWRDKV